MILKKGFNTKLRTSTRVAPKIFCENTSFIKHQPSSSTFPIHRAITSPKHQHVFTTKRRASFFIHAFLAHNHRYDLKSLQPLYQNLQSHNIKLTTMPHATRFQARQKTQQQETQPEKSYSDRLSASRQSETPYKT